MNVVKNYSIVNINTVFGVILYFFERKTETIPFS
ncbi:hypothetical protein LTAR_00590 [Leptolinea tardivitalis]|nr:hypothetical protein LTAR_00590 [Leptolinea tardivitalis]